MEDNAISLMQKGILCLCIEFQNLYSLKLKTNHANICMLILITAKQHRRFHPPVTNFTFWWSNFRGYMYWTPVKEA